MRLFDNPHPSDTSENLLNRGVAMYGDTTHVAP